MARPELSGGQRGPQLGKVDVRGLLDGAVELAAKGRQKDWHGVLEAAADILDALGCEGTEFYEAVMGRAAQAGVVAVGARVGAAAGAHGARVEHHAGAGQGEAPGHVEPRGRQTAARGGEHERAGEADEPDQDEPPARRRSTQTPGGIDPSQSEAGRRGRPRREGG